MDYEIMLDTLMNQKNDLEDQKNKIVEIINDGNSSLNNSMNHPEISNLYKKLEESTNQLKNGYEKSSAWFESYLTDLNNLESSLASFSCDGVDTPDTFSDTFKDIFKKVLIPTLKEGGDPDANTKLGYLAGMNEGEKYFQWMSVSNSCGLNAFMMGVNTLLGEEKYYSNSEEYAKFGYDTTTIGWGDGKAQQWINNSGLSDRIRVTGEQNIHSKEDLYEHLNNGEVVIASATAQNDSDRIFKRNNGDYIMAPYGHYIMFYKNENGVCYANDGGWRIPGGGFLSQTSEAEAENRTAIAYDPDDLDRFFSTGGNGSLTVGRV